MIRVPFSGPLSIGVTLAPLGSHAASSSSSSVCVCVCVCACAHTCVKLLCELAYNAHYTGQWSGDLTICPRHVQPRPPKFILIGVKRDITGRWTKKETSNKQTSHVVGKCKLQCILQHFTVTIQRVADGQ